MKHLVAQKLNLLSKYNEHEVIKLTEDKNEI
jgi:hypothetical protein